ncbi:MAG: aspartate aminotransferase family protein [Bacillota bacterium]
MVEQLPASVEERLEPGIYSKRGLTLIEGSGARVRDDGGREYIDCVGGHGVASVGHANREVADALAYQARRLITCPESFSNDVRTRYLQSLAEITPRGMERFFLCNSGTEAVEAAIKFARINTGRSRIVATRRAFHGRTMGALAATWGNNHRRGVEHLIGGCDHVSYGDADALGGMVDDDTAAVILELVQGEGGVYPAAPDFVSDVERICRERGARLIVDEIQTGFGRTGAWFASDHFDLAPDLMCMAKAIAGGVPMGAVGLGSGMDDLPAMSHGSTFGGNPLACAAAQATLDFMLREDLVSRSARLGRDFLEALRSLHSPLIREVRGLGLMIGMQMRVRVTPILRALQQEGILALPAGSTVLRFLPPLVISEEDLDTVVATLARVLDGMADDV